MSVGIFMSMARDTLIRAIFRAKSSIISLSVILGISIIAYLAPLIAPYDPRDTSFSPFQPPS